MHSQRHKIVKSVLSKNDNNGGFTLPDLKLCYNTMAIDKTVYSIQLDAWISETESGAWK